MAKRYICLLLVLIVFAASTVVSMAGNGEAASFKNLRQEQSGIEYIPVIETLDEEQYIEEYSYEAVLEEYGKLFFDPDSKSEITFICDIRLLPDSSSNDVQDYDLNMTLDKGVNLEEGNSIVIVVFVEKEEGYELLTTEERTSKYSEPIKFQLPFIGVGKPNNIRVVVFPKNSYQNLSLEKNIQIYDEVITIKKSFKLKTTLKGLEETLMQVGNSLK